MLTPLTQQLAHAMKNLQSLEPSVVEIAQQYPRLKIQDIAPLTLTGHGVRLEGGMACIYPLSKLPGTKANLVKILRRSGEPGAYASSHVNFSGRTDGKQFDETYLLASPGFLEFVVDYPSGREVHRLVQAGDRVTIPANVRRTFDVGFPPECDEVFLILHTDCGGDTFLPG